MERSRLLKARSSGLALLTLLVCGPHGYGLDSDSSVTATRSAKGKGEVFVENASKTATLMRQAPGPTDRAISLLEETCSDFAAGYTGTGPKPEVREVLLAISIDFQVHKCSVRAG